MNRNIPTTLVLVIVISSAAFVRADVYNMPSGQTSLEWVTVGNPGNVPDTVVMYPDGTTGYGSVSYMYRFGKYDVTNSQFTEFLNAKDPNGSNTLGLYNGSMAGPYGGITFSAGNSNGTKYATIPGRENHPVDFVGWYDAIRFANWLNNGQGNGDTESGAYTLLGGTPTPSNGDSITRNLGARVFLPSEDEWYKAAYYNPATNSYFQYPTNSDVPPIATTPTGLSNRANYEGAVGTPTDVGAYSGTTSPYGAFDMGGNVWQWNEALIVNAPPGYGYSRGLRGGGFLYGGFSDSRDLLSSTRFVGDPTDSFHFSFYGFRLAMVPEPGSIALMLCGAGGLLVWGVRRKR